MASLLRMGALPRMYARVACRSIQTSAARKYYPVPKIRPEYGSELAALQAKEQGPWTELTIQEKIDCELFYLTAFTDIHFLCSLRIIWDHFKYQQLSSFNIFSS